MRHVAWQVTIREAAYTSKDASMLTEMVGWISALILILTISRQVYTQWRTKSTVGVSHWLFVGQVAASVGFVIYSFLVENWVFVAANACILVTAMVGQYIYMRNKHNSSEKPAMPSDKK
jgi:MtN3 and saliva related transmembrane protein